MPQLRPVTTAALAALCAALPAALAGQRPPPPPPTRPPADTSMADMPGMNMRDVSTADTAAAGMTMHAPNPLGIPMARTGSGTSWTPDAVSLPMYMTAAGTWDLMLHGAAFGQYDAQGGPRGRSQFGSLNWGMVMASHALFGGRFQARAMLSLDPATVTGRGYPLLLQSGESYDGRPLVDRQHPHNLFMEASALYERPVTRTLGVSLYAAPSGDPALGPVAFMHRPSAMDVPTAPIGHHWQDATHTTFGVVTAGVFTRAARLEVSAFNGREPDQDRYGFDPIRLNSYAGRLTVNPSVNWSLSGSYGALTSPEALHPEESVHRATASAMYGAPLGTAGQWATTMLWGANKYSTRAGLAHSGLVEAEAVLDRSNAVFGRAEVVQKSADDLSLDAAGGLTPTALGALPAPSPGTRFAVGAVSLGYVREVARPRGVTLGLGGMGTLNVVPSTLRDVYGSRTPVGGLVFLRVRPIGQRTGGMGRAMPGMHGAMEGMDHGGHQHP